MRLVTIDTPGLCTPRVVMHWCAASTTTATPRGLQHVLQRVGDLRRHLLLDLQPLRVDLDEPRQLRDADDAPVRQVADVHLADDRHHVVLAMALEADVGQHDDLVVAVDLLERAREHRLRVVAVAGEELLVGAHDAAGRLEQALARRVVAGPADQRADRVLGLLARRGATTGAGAAGGLAGGLGHAGTPGSGVGGPGRLGCRRGAARSRKGSASTGPPPALG